MPSISDFSNSKLYHAQIGALARLHLFLTSETHSMVLEFTKQANVMILRAGGKDGVIDGASALKLQKSLNSLWGETISEWVKTFQSARTVAAQLPFGLMAEFHERLVADVEVEESRWLMVRGSVMLQEVRVRQGVFDPQIKILTDTAAEYLYGDGLNLSDRIWNLDNETRNQMNQIILQAVTNGTSAWDLAKEMEALLGANQDCPRWTSTRLYKTSKKDIAAGDLRGLVSGDACDGQGVAYNALRLARTELQKIHALATDKVLMNSPWVEQEQVNLSKGHAEQDICDQIISEGEKGEGIYPVGTINLPLHPNCLCYKTAVLMKEDEFIDQLRGWMKGEQTWDEMDAYTEFIGVGGAELTDKDLSKEPALLTLAVWLFSEDLSL